MADTHDERAEAQRRHDALRPPMQTTVERALAAMRASAAAHARCDEALARAESVAAASERMRQQSRSLRAELRTTITTYVRQLRDEGVPSERVVVLVKTAMRESALTGRDAHEARELMGDVVRWSVEAFYEPA